MLFVRISFCYIILSVLFDYVQTADFEEKRIVQNGGCQTLGRVYSNGTEWIPVNRSNCMKCSCLNGKADCDWIDCVTNGIDCKGPRELRNECCRICRRNRIQGKRRKGEGKLCAPRKKQKKKEEKTEKTQGKARKERKGKRNRRNKKSRRRNRRRKNRQSSDVKTVTPTPISTIGRSSASEQTTLPNIFKSSPTEPLGLDFFRTGICMSVSEDKVIYRHYEKRHGIYIAFDDLVSSHIEVLWWKLTKGKLSEMQIYKYPADEFRQNITMQDILGATTNSEIKTFKRRLARQMGICAKRDRCRSKVIKRAFFCFEIKNVSYRCDGQNN